MEMLSDTKRGWQGRSGVQQSMDRVKQGGNSQHMWFSRRRPTTGSSVTSDKSKEGLLHAPRNHAQFQRAWRRQCHSDNDRRHYMNLIGPGRLPELFRVEMEPHILAQMVSIICGEFQPLLEGQDNRFASSSLLRPRDQANASRSSYAEGVGDCSSWETSSNLFATCGLEWLDALTRTCRFELNVLFLEKTEKLKLSRVFGFIAATFAEKVDENSLEVSAVQNAYGL